MLKITLKLTLFKKDGEKMQAINKGYENKLIYKLQKRHPHDISGP